MISRRLALTLAFLGASVAWGGSVCPASTGGNAFPHPPDASVTGCNVLITINADRSSTVVVRDSVPYDASDDFIVGIQNNSSTTVPSLSLSGSGIFGFENDGICIYTFTGNGYCSTNAAGGSSVSGVDPYDYAGPTSTFANYSSINTGTVNFNPPIAAGGSTYFSLEGAPTSTLAVTVAPGGTGGAVGTPALSVWAGLMLGSLLLAYSVSVIRKSGERRS
jgi:hypothetical protein